MIRDIKVGRVKIAVAMSGGVDSSVAALLLKQRGYQIIGLTMSLLPCGQEKEGGCCGREAVESARKVAYRLNVPHYVLNFRLQFRKTIIQPFCQEYLKGRTPNPCIECNRYIKFGILLKRAKELGADFLATGHYARLRQIKIKNQKSKIKNTNKKSKIIYQILKGGDKKKDQSYFLHCLNQEQLRHILFPLGELTKKRVRQIAQKNKLPVAQRPESQEICFIPDNNYRKFLKENLGEKIKSGVILDKSGKILGKHQGVAFYTIGQRKGLVAGNRRPLYVIKIDPLKNILIIGENKDLFQKELVVKNLNWVTGQAPRLPMKVTAKIRYQHPGAQAIIMKQQSRVICRFLKPQPAITPGQSAVFYIGDSVIGGGIIKGIYPRASSGLYFRSKQAAGY